MSDYLQKLKDPRWQKKRLQIFERDKWKCQCCFTDNKTLHVHHLDYLPNTDPWDYDDSYLTTLCEDCHSEITEVRPIFEKLIISRLRLQLKSSPDFQLAYDVLKDYDLSVLFTILRFGKEEINKLIQEYHG